MITEDVQNISNVEKVLRSTSIPKGLRQRELASYVFEGLKSFQKTCKTCQTIVSLTRFPFLAHDSFLGGGIFDCFSLVVQGFLLPDPLESGAQDGCQDGIDFYTIWDRFLKHFGRVWGSISVPTWLHVGVILDVLGFCAALVAPNMSLGMSWCCLGCVLGHLGVSWVRLGGVL